MKLHSEPLVTAEDVAERFGVSVGTVNRWVRAGAIPCIRPSRRIVRFRLDDVERALSQPVSTVESVSAGESADR